MKVKKKTAMLLSFTLGTLLLATTALADIATKSGYDQLKDALKVTAQQSNEKFNSYTIDYSTVMKDNGKTLSTSNSIQKYDRSKNATEHLSSSQNLSGDKYNSQSYSDKTTVINVSDRDQTYYVQEFTKERKEEAFRNPFKGNSAEDVEKIADAIVGSLKDNVVVTENLDGSRGLSGSLTEVQIPALVNAVTSFQLKQQFSGRQVDLPHLSKDVFVKEIKGSAKINKDGVMENILGSAVLSGKDEQGKVHEVTVEVLAKLSGINSTIVTKPDLTGKKVINKSANNGNQGSEISNPEKFVGKFKNDILIEKGDKFVKVGQRFIQIAHMDDKTVAGRYYEEYKPGFEEYATNKSEFKFDAQFEPKSGGHSASFDLTNEAGNKAHWSINFDEHGGKVYLNINGYQASKGGLLFDSVFTPALD